LGLQLTHTVGWPEAGWEHLRARMALCGSAVTGLAVDARKSAAILMPGLPHCRMRASHGRRWPAGHGSLHWTFAESAILLTFLPVASSGGLSRLGHAAQYEVTYHVLTGTDLQPCVRFYACLLGVGDLTLLHMCLAYVRLEQNMPPARFRIQRRPAIVRKMEGASALP